MIVDDRGGLDFDRIAVDTGWSKPNAVVTRQKEEWGAPGVERQHNQQQKLAVQFRTDHYGTRTSHSVLSNKRRLEAARNVMTCLEYAESVQCFTPSCKRVVRKASVLIGR